MVTNKKPTKAAQLAARRERVEQEIARVALATSGEITRLRELIMPLAETPKTKAGPKYKFSWADSNVSQSTAGVSAGSEDKLRQAADLINSSLLYIDTEEGYEFWRHLYRRLYALGGQPT